MEPDEILPNGEISPQMFYITNADSNVQISSSGRATVTAYSGRDSETQVITSDEVSYWCQGMGGLRINKVQ